MEAKIYKTTKETNLCKQCVKRTVCKYTDDKMKLEANIHIPEDLKSVMTVNVNCREFYCSPLYQSSIKD